MPTKDRSTPRPIMDNVLSSTILTPIFGGASSVFVPTPTIYVPFSLALEPFLIQPPVDAGDGDPEADNVDQPAANTYAAVDVFERFPTYYKLTVDANDPGTSPGGDPRCELRGTTSYTAEDGLEFTVDAQIVSFKDGSTDVFGGSNRITHFQMYNEAISNPDITVDGRIDANSTNFFLSFRYRPNQADSIYAHEIDTGVQIAADGTHPRVPFRVRRYPDRLEFFFGANVDGTTPDFTTGDSGTPAFSRSSSDGDFHIKCGAYVHFDASAPATTRAVVHLFDGTSAVTTDVYVPVPPVYSAQPTLSGGPVVGSTITLFEGNAAPNATLSYELFTVGGIDRTSELVGNTWDSTGYNAGDIVRFQTRATNADGFTLSDVVQLTLTAAVTVPGPPGTPVLSAGSDVYSEITATWADPVDDGGAAVSGFDVRWATVTPSGWTEELDVSPGWTLTGIADGTEVFVQARAVNSQGAGAWTSTASRFTVAHTVPGAPPAPTMVRGGTPSTEAVASWSAPTETGGTPVLGYDFRWAEDALSGWTQLDDETSPYTITGRTPASTINGQVRAFNAQGDGPWSSTGSVILAAAPSDVTAPVIESVSYNSATGDLDITLVEASGTATVVWAEADDADNPTYSIGSGWSGTTIQTGSFGATTGSNTTTITVGDNNELTLYAYDGDSNLSAVARLIITPAAGSPTITYVDTVEGGNAFSTSVTHSYTAGDITSLSGNAAVAIVVDGGAKPTVASVTIGGVAATIVQQGADTAYQPEASIWEASGPFTDDDVVITTTGAMDAHKSSLFDLDTLSSTGRGGEEASADNVASEGITTTSLAGDQCIAVWCRNTGDAANTSFAAGATAVEIVDIDAAATTVAVGINTNMGANETVTWNRSTGFPHTSRAVGVFA